MTDLFGWTDLFPARTGLSRALLLAAVLGLSSAVPAVADDDRRLIGDDMTLIGLGWGACGTWTARRTARHADPAPYEQWVLGYLSGVAAGSAALDPPKRLNPLNGVDAQAVSAWMDNYCRAHPLVTIFYAANAFVREHPGGN
jgi:hypothetical protein